MKREGRDSRRGEGPTRINKKRKFERECVRVCVHAALSGLHCYTTWLRPVKVLKQLLGAQYRRQG